MHIKIALCGINQDYFWNILSHAASDIERNSMFFLFSDNIPLKITYEEDIKKADGIISILSSPVDKLIQSLEIPIIHIFWANYSDMIPIVNQNQIDFPALPRNGNSILRLFWAEDSWNPIFTLLRYKYGLFNCEGISSDLYTVYWGDD